MPRSVALIVAGAVAKGAFAAGAIDALVTADVPLRRIVATSSGALNGAVLAAGIRASRAREAAANLLDVWRSHASWAEVFHLNAGDIFHGSGLSDQSKILAMLRERVHPAPPGSRTPIELRVVVSPLDGRIDTIHSEPATSYEAMIPFDATAFDSAEGLERVFHAAVASASFPGAFAPMNIDDPALGPCVDGGAVNNTPIKYALDGVASDPIEAIVIVTPTQLVAPPKPGAHGLSLVAHVADVLINERLYRDLREAESINQSLRALDALVPGTMSPEQLAAAKRALGWEHYKQIPIVQVRPANALPGDAFSGFFKHDEREAYIVAGRDAARDALRAAGWA
jgi:NTE family protein